MFPYTVIVRRVIAETLQVNPEKVVGSAKLRDDLGADDLGFVDVIMALEKEFNIVINDEQSLDILTVQDAVDFIAKHV